VLRFWDREEGSDGKQYLVCNHDVKAGWADPTRWLKNSSHSRLWYHVEKHHPEEAKTIKNQQATPAVSSVLSGEKWPW